MKSNLEQFFDDFSSEYDKKLKNSYFSKNLYWVVEEIFGKIYSNILDIGCGTGLLLNILNELYPNSKLNGIDISEKMILKATNNVPRANIVKSDVHSLPFDDEKFDLVVCTASFHHYENDFSVMNEVKRVLKPGGKFIVLDSIRDPFYLSWLPYYWDWIDSRKCYSKHLHEKEFVELFHKSGLTEIKYSRKYKLLPVVHLLISGVKGEDSF